MSLCACGCGTKTRARWANGGHMQRALGHMGAGNKGAVPFSRVQPLLRYLLANAGLPSGYGRYVEVARMLGVSYGHVWAIDHGKVSGISYRTASAIVAAVKAQEAALRASAVEPESIQRRHERHAARGESDVACEWCWKVGVPV